jgi:Rrf2 family iron-sulfur cluster assembly transcriptional regulator
MLITNKSRYATLALCDLAAQTGHELVSLAELADHYQISVSYLEQIFAKLRTRGLVSSARGPGGGYRLAREADTIALVDILALFDRDETEDGQSAAAGKAVPQRMWRTFDSELRNFLSGLTLGDLLASSSTARQTPPPPRARHQASTVEP